VGELLLHVRDELGEHGLVRALALEVGGRSFSLGLGRVALLRDLRLELGGLELAPGAHVRELVLVELRACVC
jgi:hypothetical protein